MFLSLGSVVLNFGILLIYCLGALLPWRFVSTLAPIFYFLFFIALWRIPEPKPPQRQKGTQEDTREALMRYLVCVIISLLYVVMLEGRRMLTRKSFRCRTPGNSQVTD